jgi:hypothetical protein
MAQRVNARLPTVPTTRIPVIVQTLQLHPPIPITGGKKCPEGKWGAPRIREWGGSVEEAARRQLEISERPGLGAREAKKAGPRLLIEGGPAWPGRRGLASMSLPLGSVTPGARRPAARARRPGASSLRSMIDARACARGEGSRRPLSPLVCGWWWCSSSPPRCRGGAWV